MRKKVLRVVGNIAFYVTLIAVVLGVALFGLQEPDAAPRSLGGYSVMTVLSGSMRPTIPVRSLIIIDGNVDANDLEVGDIITHLRPNNTTVTHRIIEIEENYRGFGERGFRLQGDHNSLPDREIILARNVIGRVTFHNLFLGQTVFFIQEHIILIVIFGGLGAALTVVIKKFFLIKDEEERELEQAIENDEVDEPSTTTNRLIVEEEFQARKRNWKKPLQLSLLVLLIGFFSYSIYRVLAYQALYREIEAASDALRNQHIQTITVEDRDEDEEIDQTTLPHRTFLAVDWDGLLARNPDVVAWLHVPGTNINYPVLAGATNEEYLRLDLDRQHSVAGSIFLEENNANDFTDLNTILYGHHMFNGSKFADVHAFVDGNIRIEDVPYIYLYLPDGRVFIYQIIGAHLTTNHSPIYHLPVTDLTAFHERIAADNRLTLESELDLDAPILTLSTCSESGIANEVRSVIFGTLIEQHVTFLD
jgi:sortase B